MIQLLSGRDANEAWLEAVDLFRSGTAIHSQESRVGPTHEILHVGFTIEDPRQRWVVSRTPTINIAFAIAEVVWIMTGRQDSEFLKFWNSQLPKFSGDSKNFHGAYGHRLRKHFEIDQLERAFNALQSNPESRQIVLQIWDARIDLPKMDGHPSNEDIPCNLMSLLKVRQQKLEWFQIIRSNDIFLGLPYNFVQFTYMQEILAGWLGLGLGSFNQISDSLHVYDSRMKDVLSSSRISSETNNDAFVERKEQSEALFGELGRRMDQMSRDKIGDRELEALAEWRGAPLAYQNMLCVTAAESARRSGLIDTASKIMRECTNPVFTQLWALWLSRVTKHSELPYHKKNE